MNLPFAVIREGILQEAPEVADLRGSLADRLREYRSTLRHEERELAAHIKALQSSKDIQAVTMDRVTGLKVRRFPCFLYLTYLLS